MNDAKIAIILDKGKHLVKNHKYIFVEVIGPHDTWWVRIAKKAAISALVESEGQLYARNVGRDCIVISANESYDD